MKHLRLATHNTKADDMEQKLRHIYHRGTHDYPNLHRYMDIHENTTLQITTDGGATIEAAPEQLRVKVASINIQRLADREHAAIDSLLRYAEVHGESSPLPASAWTVDEIAGPNTTDQETVTNFAKMAANSYVIEPGTGNWEDVKGGFNHSDDFGWDSDGLRGYIFADKTNSTIVIALKGTSAAVFDGAETTSNDKVNDNLFGSCCCGQGGPILWRQVCECQSSAYTCNSTCLVQSIHHKGRYYPSVLDLYRNVTDRYPKSDVWLAGHSLGGVVSALLGLTYGLPTMTYEAFPDALAASRIGLPVPPGYKAGSHQSRPQVGIHHYGHTADPIFMGECNGGSSFCSLAGYAFEGSCHTGVTCKYDTVGDFGWRVGIGTHRILSVVHDVLEKYDDVPECEEDVDCQDCYNWKFFESNGTETTTTSSSTSTSTRTRTETCKTPGWWGCLDETATTTTTSMSTSSSSTSTCETPGWFGCKDPITTTTTTTTTTKSSVQSASPTPTQAPVPTVTPTASSSSTICHRPGWFGCKDPITTTFATSSPSSTPARTTHASTMLSSSSCTSKAWLGLICLDPYPTSSSTPPPSSPTTSPTPPEETCAQRNWFGWCKEWRSEQSAFKLDL